LQEGNFFLDDARRAPLAQFDETIRLLQTLLQRAFWPGMAGFLAEWTAQRRREAFD
jgi:hypothetical protein